jgi:hypothetical protein
VGLEPTTPVFERTQTVHALDRAATVIGSILALDGGKWTASHSVRFFPREMSLYPLDGRMGESQNRSGNCIEEKYLLRLLTIEIRFFGRPACMLVNLLSDLF